MGFYGVISVKDGRDNYLHRIYKNLLKDEVEENLGYTQCMVEKLSYPSHL